MPIYLGDIVEFVNNTIKTSQKKIVTLDEFHSKLPFRIGDSLYSVNKKILTLIPITNECVSKKISSPEFELASSFSKEILINSYEYIRTVDFSPGIDKNKNLASFFNLYCWKELNGNSEIFYNALNKKISLSICEVFCKKWIETHLLRQFELWNISESQFRIMLDYLIDETEGRLDLEDFIITFTNNPYKFLFINSAVSAKDIEHVRQLFEIPKIPDEIFNIKRTLFYSQDSYINYDNSRKDLETYGLVTFDSNTKICLTHTYKIENYVFNSLKMKIKKCDYDWSLKKINFVTEIDKLSEDQQSAMKLVFSNPISIITGGPGTGKTKVIHSIIKECNTRGIKYHVAAFTGKAVGRVKEVSHPEVINSSTIDMMITRGPNFYKFNLLILEEASMINTKHMYKLFSKFNPTVYKIVLVGDIDQIPPIEKGHFFSSLLWSKRIPYIRLTKNFRIDQVYGSDIIRNAYKIIDPHRKTDVDFDYETNSFNILKGDLELLKKILKQIVDSGNPINKLTILTPYNNEVRLINKLFQEIIYSPKDKNLFEPISKTKWFVGDKIMSIKNVLTDDLANGDLGHVTSISDSTLEITLDKDLEKPVVVNLYKKKNTLNVHDNFRHSYCLTINKSQGSEYEVVVLYLSIKDSDEFFLNMNMIYTAITRAKKMVWIICEDPNVLLNACNNRLKVPKDIFGYQIIKNFDKEYILDFLVEEVEEIEEYSDWE